MAKSSQRQLVSNRTKARVARKAAPVVAKGGVKAARATGRHAIRGAKAEAKLAHHALRSREPRSARYTKYAIFAVAGFAIGRLLSRLGGERNGASPSFSRGTGQHNAGPGSYQTPGEPNQIGADCEYSDPASGPLIGEESHPEMDMTERNQITEQKVRTSIGEQVDTEGLPKINVEVNDGVAELRGPVPSEDLKQRIGEIASGIGGVREVRNNLTVDSV